MEEDSAADMFNTASRTTEDDSELRKQQRRQINRESAKRSRYREKISMLCEYGKSMSDT
ncbi:hypothetical protein F3Y22_tig00110474pilonHSYRG00160 [Hibiscus syriacus]|uniref:BZIP domain-containing protein n=1 Tax=Hibiscus syriacus TaxID=106335 RepID=A0A6A3AK21_HIBSY|nr:hypothetical protein F3Y22_tig00110474pilonHSYRG00160 [Hibiscus syriacus]